MEQVEKDQLQRAVTLLENEPNQSHPDRREAIGILRELLKRRTRIYAGGTSRGERAVKKLCQDLAKTDKTFSSHDVLQMLKPILDTL
jgi:hypothetical protein